MGMVAVKFGISFFAMIAGILLFRYQQKLSFGTLLTYYIMRIFAIYALITHFGFSYPSDVPGFYEQANRVINGEIPNRDFVTPYGFLFNYLLAGTLLIWNSPFSIMVFFSFAEFIGVLLISNSLMKIKGRDVANKTIILLLMSPIILQSLWLGAQDEALQILLVGGLLFLYQKKKQNQVTCLSILGLHMTKIFSMWLVAPYLLGFRRKQWLLFVGLYTMTIAILAAFRIRFLSVGFERASGVSDALSSLITAGNVWYVIKQIFGFVPRYIPEILVLLLFIIFSLFILGKRNDTDFVADEVDELTLGFVGFSLIFAIFYKMTFCTYLVGSIPFLILFVTQQGGRSLFIVYSVWSVLVSINDVLCFRILRNTMKDDVWLATTLLEIVIVILTGILLFELLQTYWRHGHKVHNGLWILKKRLCEQ